MAHIFFRLAAAAVAAFVLTAPVIAQSKREPIGAITYGNRPMRDIVEIGELKVAYANGSAEDVRVREIFKGKAALRVDGLQTP